MNPAQRRSLFSLYLAYFADYFSWGVAIAYLAIYIGTDQSPFTNLYWNTDIALGIAIACFPIGEVIGSPLLGGFSDSLGRRKILIGGLLASVLSLILCAIGLWSGCFLTFLLGQLLAGFFSGKQAMTQAAIAEIDAETKSQKLAFLSVLGGLAWITGPYVGNLLLGESFIQTGGFIWPSLLAAFICGVSLLCTYFFFKDTYRPNEPGPEGSGLRSSDRSSSSAQPHLYDTRPALVNFGEHFLCSSALLDRSKPSRFGATSAMLLEPKICCPNSPDLTAHRIKKRRIRAIFYPIFHESLFVLCLLNLLGWYLVLVSISYYFIQKFNLSNAELGLFDNYLSLCFTLGGILSTAWVLHRFRARKILFWMQTSGSFALLALLGSSSIAEFWIYLAVPAITEAVIYPTYQTIISDQTSDRNQGKVFGLIHAINGICQLMAWWLLAVLSSDFVGEAILLSALLFLVSGVFFIPLYREKVAKSSFGIYLLHLKATQENRIKIL
jgi:MFS family permease